MNAQPEPRPETRIAVVSKDVVDQVMTRVGELQTQGRLAFPPNYSPQNALMSAYLVLQTTKDKDNRPVLAVCTRDSVANSLLDMVVQGLNPMKKQCYFIAYGQQLTCQRSYFGTVAITKRVTGARDVYAEVVYKDDGFEYELVGGNSIVTRHIRKLANIDKGKIVAAYCTIVREDGELYTQVMTMDQIIEAWKKSQTKPVDEQGKVRPGSTHGQFTEEMAKKTVINRTCKMFINSSDDSSLDLVLQHMREADERAEELAFEEEVQREANGEIIDADIRDAEEPEPPVSQAAAQMGPDW